MKTKIQSIVVGILISIIIFLFFGILTSLIQNPWFTRMVIPTSWDYVVLVLSSLLLGTYIGLTVYKNNVEKSCDYVTASGALFGLFAFGCPICNILLVSLFSVSALMTYFNPYRPILGLLSIGLLGSAVIFKVKNI